LLCSCFLAVAVAAERPTGPRLWFNRVCAHYGKVDDAFADYIADVRPQVAMCGNFGPNYWAAVSYARDKGEPTLWTALGGGPVDRQWWRRFIRTAHQRKIKVVGLFCLTCTFGDPDKPAGFFKFYDQEWDRKALGEKPPGRAADLMQRQKDGTLHQELVYRIEDGGEYWGCPSNARWREVLKAMVTAAIKQGVDGFIIVFPHRRDCVCEHCQRGFRKWLAARYDAAALKERFGIDELATHRFTSINGWYDADKASPYALECLKFSESVLKDCFDEVFVEHARRQKPDLILGQWNHIYRASYEGPGQLAGTFAQLNADERCVLPTERWSAGEDFVWYSIGNWRMYDKPGEGEYAQFVVERKYLYEAGGGKPSSVKADDPVRTRFYIAEAVANGGFAYPRGPQYTDPETRRLVKQYFAFLARHQALYHPVETVAEAALVWNRLAVHQGDTAHTADFKRLGTLLVKNHALFDVLLDENIRSERLKKYRLVLLPGTEHVALPAWEALAGFVRTGGKVVICRRDDQRESQPLAGAIYLPSADLQAIEPTRYQQFEKLLGQWLPDRSTAAAPDTVALTCFAQPRDGDRPPRLIVHLVNALRNREPEPGAKGAAQEQPIAQQDVAVRLRLPADARAKAVHLASPERPEPVPLEFEQGGRFVEFVVPEMLVYAVATVEQE